MREWRWWIRETLRLRTLLRRGRMERDLDEEMQFHIDHLIEREIAKGLSPVDARNAALRAMEGLEQKKEECRDMRRTQWIDQFLQDLKYASRSLLKNPTVSLVAFASLALGIGANTAIFSLINTVLMRPLPGVASPEGLVRLTSGQPSLPD
jgi:putative ABC transport system permease protein